MYCRHALIITLLCFILACGCSRKPRAVMPSPTTPEYIEAQELKLKVRELADQLLATLPNDCLTGLVALPTSFVNLDNFQQTSPFGRLVGENLIYEFNQRSFPVREYRLPGHIAMRAEQGDFALARQGMLDAKEKWAALLVGTYQRDKNAVFVNARLVRAADGMVLRTAQLILVNTEMIARLTASTLPPAPPPTPVPTLAQTSTKMTQNTAAGNSVAIRPSSMLTTGTLTIKQGPAQRPKQAPKGSGLWGQGVQQ